jgi:hypothetical protein
MTSQHDATLYSTLTAGSRFSASSQTCHADDGSRESEERTFDLVSGNDPPTDQCRQHYEDHDEIRRALGMTPVGVAALVPRSR